MSYNWPIHRINRRAALAAAIAAGLAFGAMLYAAPAHSAMVESFAIAEPGTTGCRYVSVNPYSERDTLAAALRDAAAIVASDGCAIIEFDPSADPAAHGIGPDAKGARG